ncbi:MAG: hypothetical protein BGO41_11095 [Clostridiales bacterium 38-18]|nr:MAG: hypothetical protein BGO41_11095 [Clostridiales bacterium 38-18]
MKKMITVMLAILLVASLVLAGCSAKEEEKQSLRIGVMSDLGAAPFVVAKENGFFDKLGLDVEITVFKSATDRDTAMQTGNLDAAMADMLTIVFYNDGAFDSKMIAATYGDYVMSSTPSLDASALKALDQINVGISANTVIDFATQQIAESLGVEGQVETVAIPQMPVRLEMLAAGELQAATLPEPLASAAVLGAGEKVSGTLELGLEPGIFIATQAVIDEKSAALEKLMEGYNQGVDYLNDTEQGTYIQLLIDQLGFPPTLAESFDFPTLAHATAANEATFAKVLSWMQERELTTSEYSYSDLNEGKFIK